MGNKWDEMRAAYIEAERQVQATDTIINNMASMLRGRLRKVDAFYLKELKRELRSFNAGWGQWTN